MKKLYLIAFVAVLIVVAAILIILGNATSSDFNRCNSELAGLYQSQNNIYFEWQKDYGDMTYYHVLATEYLLMAHVLDDFPLKESNYFEDFKKYRSEQREKWDPITDSNNKLYNLSFDIKRKTKECGEILTKSTTYLNWTLFIYVIVLILSIKILKKSRK